MFNFQSRLNNDDELEVTDGETVGTLFDPSSVNIGTIPSDLIRDEIAETAFIRDFVTKFKDKIGDKDASEWIRVLGEYATGEAELSELEAVDVSDLMEIEGFEDYYYGVVPRPLTEDEIVDGVNVTVLEKKYGKEIVDAIFDTAGEAIDIIKQTAEDPQAAIDKFIDTYGTKTKEGSWKDWTEVGIFGGIAGIPLPPGFIGGTVRELEDKLKEVGATISDVFSNPEETLEKIGKWVTDTVDSVLSGTADSPWGTSTIGSIGNWVVDILGPTLGSTILSTTSSAIETSIQDAILNLGGTDTETDDKEDSTDRFSQLLGTVQTNLETDDVVDIGADSTLDNDDTTDNITNLLGGAINQLDDNTTTVLGGTKGGDITGLITNLLNTTISQFDDTEKPDDTVIGGGDLEDPVIDYPPRGTFHSSYCETKGEDGGTLVTNYNNGTGGTYSESSFSSSCKTIVTGGGDGDLNFDDEPVIEIGGEEEPEAAMGGGGAVGGGQASATPFMKLVPYTRTVPLALQPSMPTNYASGLMASPTMAQASGLMRPTNSMDVLGQLIARNIKA